MIEFYAMVSIRDFGTETNINLKMFFPLVILTIFSFIDKVANYSIGYKYKGLNGCLQCAFST